MLEKIVSFSLKNKLLVLLFTAVVVGAGTWSLLTIPIGAVPDATSNQVQIITTSRNLATEDVEKFITYPVELEMANLPNVKEIRSISKFGISVVTVIFDDEPGTWLPRQLIAEKIKSAEEKIPAGFGKPFMGPVTTGLGEIYQYTLETKPEYKDQYSVMDLRTIQDWVVRRQLSGIPGVVEVNTWGGHLKQYEIAVDPQRMKALDVSLTEIYKAAASNNNLSGGSYIEKGVETYFVRGEGLMASLDDIGATVVKVRDDVPVLIRDVAEVRYGVANRYGAVTGNGEGEKVMGQVMLLKDADSKKVIEAVHARVQEIEKLLPEGVYINPFLERSELIGKTTFTIAENLILGCLIVVFIVVLLLGNFRSGLVVASVIPLCLFFALILMKWFGVDANLMSLGAIDFGIIIDGAVIIVEFIAYRITREWGSVDSKTVNRKEKMDEITFRATTKMMRSAIFGQIIIMIVFIPIFALGGVEGKMFIPMALVFCFALLGAMLLCFTYVPVMASLFLRPSTGKRTISVRLIDWLEKVYSPMLTWVLRKRLAVISVAGATFAGALLLFGRMGGEFVPTLDEGDLIIQPIIRTGTSLSETVHLMTEMETILRGFQEVDQVVSRVGAGEVPTDPMSMEEADVMIRLKPKGEWESGRTKDELTDAMKKALEVIPGTDYEFTQPIEMRFNELITGVRADLAVKVVGEDLEILSEKAKEIGALMRTIEGASDVSVEKVDGLPQLVVRYNRNNMARYGVTVEQVNDVLKTGFGGTTVGTIFEGEKQFDLVVRFDSLYRESMADLRSATVTLDNGMQLPFSAVADVELTEGPAKISRDNTHRRVVVGVNVRNRDLESVVRDAQQLINQKIQLPKGYTVEYGGQFENLRSATARLTIAVPIALLLIFVLLYFAFGTLRDALMIYSAIPLAAVGGILFLYIRDLPFSISAGVGFIALFGIAVLNGIVLIEHYKEMKAHGVRSLNRRILQGTKERLRPVLLTASAAALGFLPMAISTSAGAEVQRPLATVVIGGLITSTILTLFVLPVLYAMFEKRSEKRKKLPANSVVLAALLMALPTMLTGQEVLSRDQALERMHQNNANLKAAQLQAGSIEQLEHTALEINRTDVYFNFDQNNIAPNNLPLQVWGIGQSIPFPTVFGARKQLVKAQSQMAQSALRKQVLELEKEVELAYNELAYWQEVNAIYKELDSLYRLVAEAAKLRYTTGETAYLDQLSAEGKRQEIDLQQMRGGAEMENARLELSKWIEGDVHVAWEVEKLNLLEVRSSDTVVFPMVEQQRLSWEVAKKQWMLERQNYLPDLQLTLFQGTNRGVGTNNYYGVQAGISIPLSFGSQRAKVKAMSLAAEGEEWMVTQLTREWQVKEQQVRSRLQALRKAVDYYTGTGNELAKELVKNAQQNYESGEIDFFRYSNLLEQAQGIRLGYLIALRDYNREVIGINYMTY